MKTKEIKELINKHVTFWKGMLGLGMWNIDIYYDKVDFDTGSGYEVGRSSVNWKYLEASLTFHTNQMKDFDEEKIEKIVIHELMHVMLNEMRETGIEHEERVASMLQRAIWFVKDAENKEYWKKESNK